MSFRTVFALIIEAILLIMVMGTDVREFLIAAVCLGGLLIFSLFSVIWAALFLRFSSKCEQPTCERGKSISFILKVKGFLIFPVVCRILLRTPFKNTRKASFPIYSHIALDMLNSAKSFDFFLNCPHSGIWNIGFEKLMLSDIFGFWIIPIMGKAKRKCDIEIAVIPKFYLEGKTLEAIGSVDNYNGLSSGSWELGEIFEDNREYRHGDPLRRINWKQSVKFGEPITRMYEKPKKSRIFIAIDFYTLEEMGSCDDIYRETALYIAEYFAGLKNDISVNLLRPEGLETELTCNDAADLQSLALGLADIGFKFNTSALTSAAISDFDFYNRDRVFIITCNPHTSVMAAVKLMRSQGLFVTIISPKTDLTSITDDDEFLTVLKSSEEIHEKVGALLC